MSFHKRSFPYASAVPEIEIKRRDLGTVNAGREAAHPKVFEGFAPLSFEQAVRLLAQTTDTLTSIHQVRCRTWQADRTSLGKAARGPAGKGHDVHNLDGASDKGAPLDSL